MCDRSVDVAVGAAADQIRRLVGAALEHLK
jgi:hypothetical protein